MNGGKKCAAEGKEKGRGWLCVLPDNLFLAASLPLSVYSPCVSRLNLAAERRERRAGIKIETSLWSERATSLERTNKTDREQNEE